MRFLNYVIGLLVLVSAIQVHADNIHIAAASNLRFVLPELIEEFEQQSEHHISVSYAASGTLTTQIQHGAPFSLFLCITIAYLGKHQNSSGVKHINDKFFFDKSYRLRTLSMSAFLQQKLFGLKTFVS